ncbi:MAG: FKBP-type peptidyl-prolyl cis-trans isomerase [Bacteroidota bacterium]
MKPSLIVYALVLMLALGCAEKAPETKATRSAPVELGQSIAEIDEAKIKNWLAENDMEVESLPSGLHYVVENPGQGEKPSLRSLVEVHYHGTTLDGQVFDSTKKRGTIRFPLAKLIKGWQEGIPLIGKGGKIKLIVPSGMAYGDRQVSPDIGPNSVLIFDIELIDFEG